MKKFFVACTMWAHLAYGSNDTYDVFSLPQHDIDAVLARSTTVQILSKRKFTADIAFGCADIKYKDGVVKFCECGDGICMSLRPAWIEINGKPQWLTAPYWGIFWHYLAQFKLPIWLVGDKGPLNGLALDTFASFGGRCVRTLADLERDSVFKGLCIRGFKPSKKITDYKGIVLYRSVSGRDSSLFKTFKKSHHEFLFVNNKTIADLTNKERTYQAFCAGGMNDCVPLGKKYSTTYSSDLAQKIMRNISTDKIVIKPENSSLGCGVNIVDKKDLDMLLLTILKNKKTIKHDAHRCLSYWKFVKDKSFFVSEYAPSKLLVKDNKTYDPTMRIVFFMHHDQGVITLHVIGGFWKIPVKPLEDGRATLTEKHVTIAHAGAYYTGMLCNHNDWAAIDARLRNILPSFYCAMMERALF